MMWKQLVMQPLWQQKKFPGSEQAHYSQTEEEYK
jgi:hypothetical protein